MIELLYLQGEIPHHVYRNICADYYGKTELDAKIHTLREQIDKLTPPESAAEGEPVDYEQRITTLRQCLEHYLDFHTDDDIPEQVVGAFVEKIVVHDNSFDWHLRYNGSGSTPQHMNVGAFTLHLDDGVFAG